MADRIPDKRDELYQHLVRYGFPSPIEQWRYLTAPVNEWNNQPPASLLPPTPDVPGLTADQLHRARDPYNLDGDGHERPVDWNTNKS